MDLVTCTGNQGFFLDSFSEKHSWVGICIMDRDDLKRPFGWVLIVLSLFVVGGTLRNNSGGGPPLQQLVPFFGLYFVVLFLAVQTGLCFWFRTKIGMACIAGAFVVGLIGGGIGESFWSETTTPVPNPVVEQVLEEHGVQTTEYDWTRHKLITGACLSGIVLGFGLVRGKL